MEILDNIIQERDVVHIQNDAVKHYRSNIQ